MIHRPPARRVLWLATLLWLAPLAIPTGSLAAAPLQAPYSSYTYDFWGYMVPAPQAYLPMRVIDESLIGVGPLRDPRDLFVQDGKLYLLDSGNDRIIVLDDEFRAIQVIDQFENDGEADGFRNPQGLFVTDDDEIFVADTDQARVVILNTQGEFLGQIGAPSVDVEGVISEGFRYRPRKLVVDPARRMYVIADEVYDGFLLFHVSNGEFQGFIGAPRVAPSISDIFWSKVATEAQRQRMALFLPTEYSSVALDHRGLLLATVSAGSEEAVRRLNLSGANIMNAMGFHAPIGDIRYPLPGSGASVPGRSVFVDIEGRGLGIYSVLDRRRGRVFTYDSVGNLLYVFGGIGNAIGAFRNPVALAALGDSVLVLDAQTRLITVFEPTHYACLIHQALRLYERGKYDESAAVWKRVLQKNANYDLAYSGIGRAQFRQGDYRAAMESFRLGKDRQGYSKAFVMYRRELIGERFGILVSLVILVFIGISIWNRLKPCSRFQELRRYEGEASAPRQPGWLERVLKHQVNSVAYALHVVFHPFDGFWELKAEKRGNTLSATIILVLVSLSYVFMEQYSGFVVNSVDQRKFSLYSEFGSVVVPVLLWCGVNWALTTLMQGKGTLRDVYIATAYALTPLILVLVPAALYSNLISIEEATFYYLLVSVGTVWAGLLVFLGMMITHGYDAIRAFFTSIFTLVGIGIVLFMGLLFFALIGQITAFVMDIYTEVVFRL